MPKNKVFYQYKSAWWVRSWERILFLIVFAIFFILSLNPDTLLKVKSAPMFLRLPFAIPSPAPYPTNKTGLYPGSEISALGVVVFDVDSGLYLYKRNEEMLLAPASTTKILSALVALDTYDLDEILTVTTLINDGQDMELVAHEKLTVENLLYGALVQSANDATYALAENYPGGVEKFVEAMNHKAKEFHLEKSSFTNPVGFDDPNHKMTPLDLTRLASVALSNRTIAKMVAIPAITVSDVTHTYFHPLKNVNELLGKIPGVGGIKTGWTEEAGENLVTLVERDGHRVILVVLHSLNRFNDTATLIDWVFKNYEWENIEFTQSTQG